MHLMSLFFLAAAATLIPPSTTANGGLAGSYWPALLRLGVTLVVVGVFWGAVVAKQPFRASKQWLKRVRQVAAMLIVLVALLNFVSFFPKPPVWEWSAR